MKKVTRIAALSMVFAGIISASANVASTPGTKATPTKKITAPNVRPACPWNDPNGCNIFGN